MCYKSSLINATSTSLPLVAQSVFLKSRLSTLTAQTYISNIISISVWNFYCMEKEPVIYTALPRIFTLTNAEWGSGEGFLGLLGFRQVKDNWNVVCGDAPFLDPKVTSKETDCCCFVLVWIYLFHGALQTGQHSFSKCWSVSLWPRLCGRSGRKRQVYLHGVWSSQSSKVAGR